MTQSGNAWLICREPVHIGGADSDSRGNNNPIYRLPDRTPAIPGSSLRGALREHALTDSNLTNWFGGDPDNASPGQISLGWGWPVWWPVHVLGYGNWWVSCPSWLRQFAQLTTGQMLPNLPQVPALTDESLKNQTVFLRWVKLENVAYQDPNGLPLPQELQSYRDRLLIVPDDAINVLVDMGLVRQPRVSLKTVDELEAERKENTEKEEERKETLVKNLFSVEGIPPGAAFFFAWSTRKDVQNVPQWKAFLHQEHHLGGLWSVGYGRVVIEDIYKTGGSK